VVDRPHRHPHANDLPVRRAVAAGRDISVVSVTTPDRALALGIGRGGGIVTGSETVQGLENGSAQDPSGGTVPVTRGIAPEIGIGATVREADVTAQGTVHVKVVSGTVRDLGR
jgi:hypothetical protein